MYVLVKGPPPSTNSPYPILHTKSQ
jgi:hypothetical protein